MLLFVYHLMIQMRSIRYNFILSFLDFWNPNRMFQFIQSLLDAAVINPTEKSRLELYAY